MNERVEVLLRLGRRGNRDGQTRHAGTQRKYTDPEPLGMETGEERQASKPARE